MRLATLAWRGLTARRLRSSLTIIGVALGVALVSGTLLANQAASEAVARSAQEIFGKAELRVRAFEPAGFEPRTLELLRRIAGVSEVAPVAERRLLVSDLIQTGYNLLVLGVDPEDEARIRTYDLEAGTFIGTTPTDAMVNARWAADNGFSIGDELVLTGTRKPHLRIVGLLGELGVGALQQGNVLVMNRTTLNEAFDVPAPLAYVDLDVVDGREQDVQDALDRHMTEPFMVETVADAQIQLGRAQQGFAGIAFLFGLVALVVGSFLVVNTLAMTLSEQTREIGLLRAAGLTGRQVVGLFLRQGAAVALIGSVLGVALGVGLATLIIGFLRSTHAVLVTGVPLNPFSLLLGFGMGIAVTLAASAFPAAAAARVSPMDALRPSRQPGRTLWGRLRWIVVLQLVVVLLGVAAYPVDRGDFGVPGVALALAILLAGTALTAILLQPISRIVGRPFEWFFGAEGLLGRANLGRDRARTGLTIGALIIALSAVVTLGVVANSAGATADRWVNSVLPGGYAIRYPLPVDIDAKLPDLEDVAGVAIVTPVVAFPAVVQIDGKEPREASVAGIDPTVFSSTGSLIFVTGTREAAFQALHDGGAILVSDPIARRDKLGIGSTVQLAVPGQDAHTFTVAGIIAYSLPGRSADGSALISLADARTLFGANAAEVWALVKQSSFPDAAFHAATAQQARDDSAELLTASGLSSDLERSLDRVIGLFDVLSLLAVVIAGLGIVNTLGVSVLERAREIAILRSHGMTTGQVQAMVVAEASIMGAIGGIAAIVTGLLMSWAVVGGTASRDFGAGLAIPWPLLISVLLLGTGVAALAGLYPARLAARIPIVRTIAHHE
ncbi:MAG: FtsX-like permease family protein [Chloroflexota bacterium]